ncbi:MAG: hypothetical protein M1833_003817 [Piccolia ochrophora]|nr:MAG: hypothetical protein M1833_003817 [Piccolia ochrophora]
MRLEESFGDLDEAEYTQRAKTHTTEHLQEQETIKNRQVLSPSFSVGSGVGAAAATGGLSLIGTAYGSSKAQIASAKLNIIEPELRRRDVSLYKVTNDDTAIAIGPGIVGMETGVGVEDTTTILNPVVDQGAQTVASDATSSAVSHQLEYSSEGLPTFCTRMRMKHRTRLICSHCEIVSIHPGTRTGTAAPATQTNLTFAKLAG